MRRFLKDCWFELTVLLLALTIVVVIATQTEFSKKRCDGLVTKHFHGQPPLHLKSDLPGGIKSVVAVFGDGPFYLEVDSLGGSLTGEAELTTWYAVRKGDWVEVWEHSTLFGESRLEVKLPRGKK